MKKLVLVICCFFLVNGLCACGLNAKPNNSAVQSVQNTVSGSLAEQSSKNISVSSVVKSVVDSQKNSSASKNTSVAQSSSANLPSNVNSVITNAINSVVLAENNTVYRDIVVLPRVSTVDVVYISWQSLSPNVIDNNGKVFQTNKTQNAVLRATFNYQGYSKNQDYSLTVAPKTTESPKPSLGDLRIKNKVNVSTVSQLKTAIKNAVAGDCIVLANGNYADVNVTLENSGTKDNPIFIMAQNPFGAIISGKSFLEIKGNYVEISGIEFQGGAPTSDKGFVYYRGNNCRFSNNKIVDNTSATTETKWLSLGGAKTEVDHNLFSGKCSKGTLLCIWRETDAPNYHHIHDNLFSNFKSGGGENGFETIRVGDSKQSQSNSCSLIENNVFYKCDGEVETVSVKSGGNVVRNNTFIQNQGLLTFRHGKNNLAEGNAFICDGVENTGGIRMYDGGHTVRNNYIYKQNGTSDSRAGVLVHSGVNSVGEIPALNAQWTAYGCLVENNTFEDCVQSVMACGKYAFGATCITVKNNLFYSSANGGVRINKQGENIVFTDNMVFSPTLCTLKSSVQNLSGFVVAEYQQPSKVQSVPYLADYGAKNVKVLSAEIVGNYK